MNRGNKKVKYAIVTGVSRGLGASIAKYMIESGIHVIGLSRRENEALHVIASENNIEYEHIVCDLTDLDMLTQIIGQIKSNIVKQELSHLYLVNNAAAVQPIKRATEITADEIKMHYQVNVLAPMILMNSFLKECEDTNFIGVNITSGAAIRAKYGWSGYCSSKASLDMYTKTVALEQIEQETPHKIIGFSPGIMDTDMQAEIRSTGEPQFVDVETFKNYKAENLLSETDVVASVLVDIITDEVNIENGNIYQVQDYL